jgi:hypothetical protein
VTRSLRSALRRTCGLLLAIGLLPAAAGGAVCLEHQAGHRAAVPTVDLPADDGPAGDPHAHQPHHAHQPPGHPGPEPSGHLPAHDGSAPCTALAACGGVAVLEPTRAPAATPAPRAVLGGAGLALPTGPARTPDVPPPRR